jgi:alpha-ribazole phosphatase/probable phosphoglycerate mutase
MQRTLIDLLRHGEPVGGRKYRGQIDDPLSDKGWRQMREAVGDAAPWNAIVSSTLLRCADFAHELVARHKLPLQLDERLVEIGFGAWEGHTAAELTRDDPDRLQRFWMDPVTERPEGAETLVEFEQRVGDAWCHHLERCRGGHLLIVTHAGVVRMILTRVLGMPREHLFRIQVPGAGLTRIEVLQDGNRDFNRLLFHGRSRLDP